MTVIYNAPWEQDLVYHKAVKRLLLFSDNTLESEPFLRNQIYVLLC